MPELTLQDLQEAASVYEQLLVPAIFQTWTRHVLDAAQVQPGHRVLDVACGTGVLARAAAELVGPSGSVAGADVNPGMLAVAAELAPSVEWIEGPAESLPFEDNSFDRVVSQFGLMFFADRQAALSEMVRVLAPGGRLAVAVFDTLDRVPAYATMATVVERTVGQHAANALRFPFVFGDTKELSDLVASAGASSIEVATRTEIVRFASARSMIEGDVHGWFPLAGIFLDEQELANLVTEAEAALGAFIGQDGAVQFQMAAHLVSATRA